MSVRYTKGCAVQRGNFSTPGDIMSTLGDIMSTMGVFSTLGDIMIKVGQVLGKTIEFVWKPQYTEHPPVYS